MYWILSNEIECLESDADLSGSINYSGIEFDDGVSIRGQNFPLLKFVMNEDSKRGRMTDHLNITELHGPLFSGKAIEQFKALNVGNIEFFDIDVYDPETGTTYDAYKLVNIVGVVDCVDMEKSDLKFYTDGDIKRIWKLVLDEGKIPGEMKVFRLEKFRTIIVVHDIVKKAFEKAGVTGCVFYRPEDYD